MAILRKSFSVIATAALAAFLFTATTGCEDDPIVTTIIPDTVDTNGNNSGTADSLVVVFDNFEIHKIGTDDADSGYTNITSVGHQLIDFLAGENLQNYPSGAGWYAYASNNGARIYVYDDDSKPDYIVDSIGDKEDDDVIMEKMQGDSTLTVVFDCKDESIVKPNPLGYYYAGIGAPIGGVIDSLGSLSTVAEVVDSTVYWNFSGLKSISVKGSVQGSIIMFFEYKTDVADAWGYHAIHIAGDIETPTEIDSTYSITDFTPNGSSPLKDLKWDDHKGAVNAFVIELDTDASVGGDFAVIKLDDIKFNFETKDSKSDAFPWIE